MTGPIRVFIIDDHPVVRAGLKDLLRRSRDIAVVGEAEDGEPSAMADLESARPDVALVDIKLKRGDGIDACRTIKTRLPAVGVALLSASCNDDLVRRALDAGADAYLLKDAEHLELAKAIRSVAKGEPFFDATITAAVVRQARGGSTAADDGVLSQDDRQILGLVARGQTNKAIAGSLFLSPHTVRDRLSAIMAALGAHNRAEVVQIAARRGLI